MSRSVVVLVAAAVVALVACAGVGAAAFPADWAHSGLITIEENSGSDLVDYQILVELNASNFDFSKAQPDGADIRFAELDDILMSYWIESWNLTAESAKMWVKVPSIPTSGTTMIRMWYGNAGAVDASDGDAVFILFDDFEDGTVGSSPSGWSCSGNCNNKISSDLAHSGTQSVKMTGMSGGCWESLMHKYIGEPSPYRISFSVYPPSYSANGCHDSKGFLWLHTCASWTCSGRSFINFGRSSNHITACGSTMDYTPDRWYEVEAIYMPTASDVFTKLHINNNFFTECTSSRSSYEDSLSYLSFGSGDGYNYYDLVYVSKYVSSEPTVTVAADSRLGSFTFVHMTDVHIGYPQQGSMPGDHTESIEMFTDTLQSIKTEQPKFILSPGDLVEFNDERFFMAYMNITESLHGIYVYNTPGNHDRRGRYYPVSSSLTAYDEIVGVRNPPNAPLNDGYRDYFFDRHGYRFIGLDSGSDYNCLNPEGTPEGTGLFYPQMEALENLDPSIPKIVFMHHPAMDSVDDGEMVDDYCTPLDNECPPEYNGNDACIGRNRCNFITYCLDNNVKMVLTGHTHEDYPVKLSDTWFIQTVSATKDKDEFVHGYRVITIEEDGSFSHRMNKTPTFSRSTFTLSLANFSGTPDDIWGISVRDRYGRHTGMDGRTGEIERGIPNSYYTGHYGVPPDSDNVPQVLVVYPTADSMEVTYHAFIPMCTGNSDASRTAKTASDTIQESSTSSQEIYFNFTISHHTENKTIEYRYENVSLTNDSTASVNLSATNINYTMEIDYDGDGTPDYTKEPDSIEIFGSSDIPVESSTGTGTVYFSVDAGIIEDLAALSESDLPEENPDVDFSHGLFSFNITGLSNGETVNVTIDFPEDIPTTAQYWKYNTSSGEWYQIPIGSNDGDNIITITLQDGGIGDNDGVENGIISDPGAPGVPSAPPAAPVPSMTPIGMAILIGSLSLLAVGRIRRRFN